ncbi:MAG: triose-phosphate isomerase [Tepidiformaceae bacterium]
MRKPFVAGNWKMNTTRDEAVGLARGIVDGAGNALNCDIAICPPFPHLGDIERVLLGSPIGLGAQDVYWEARGAFTGEVSVPMLAEYCQYVIIGHSERRQFFGETDETVNRKLGAVLASTLDPIVCVGELLDERRSGQTEAVLSQQIRLGLQDTPFSNRITIAYEPIWAIGTGETATPEVAQSACAFIRSELRDIGGDDADGIRIQYGGSVNAQNAHTLMSQQDIDGALVGGASLNADQFLTIIRAAAAAKGD